jgi:hypothetical protein
VEKANLILPQILNEKAWGDQGRINMPETMRPLKISQNTAYRVRRELLKHYHEQKSLRDAQWGNTAAQMTVTPQEEKKTLQEARPFNRQLFVPKTQLVCVVGQQPFIFLPFKVIS